MTPQEAIVRLIEGREIFHDEMLDVMRGIMGGTTTPVQTSARNRSVSSGPKTLP